MPLVGKAISVKYVESCTSKRDSLFNPVDRFNVYNTLLFNITSVRFTQSLITNSDNYWWYSQIKASNVEQLSIVTFVKLYSSDTFRLASSGQLIIVNSFNPRHPYKFKVSEVRLGRFSNLKDYSAPQPLKSNDVIGAPAGRVIDVKLELLVMLISFRFIAFVNEIEVIPGSE